MKPRNLKLLSPHKRAFFSTPQLPRSSARPATYLQSKRYYIDPTYIKGMHKALFDKFKYLSPINGVVFRELEIPKKLYHLGNDSASCQLVQELYYQEDQNHQFLNTQNKSEPGYSLTPKLIAEIMRHLAAETLDNPKTREALCSEWKKTHKNLTDGKISKIKINQLLDLISRSKKECGTIYPVHMTENILLAFLCYKAETRTDLTEDYLKTLDQLNPVIENSESLNSHEFDDNDLDVGRNALQEVRGMANQPNSSLDLSTCKIFETHHENIIAYQLLNDSLAEVMRRRLGYNGQPDRPDCVETMINNVINAIMHDGRRFNFDRLPKTLEPHDKLHDFYKMQSYKATKVNNLAVKQAFMDMVSDHNFLSYHEGKNYELTTHPENVTKVLGHLFLRDHAVSLKELSKRFSDKNRQISFDRKNNVIEIIILKDGKKPVKLRLEFYTDCIKLIAPQAFQTPANTIFHIHNECDALLSALLHKKNRIYNESIMKTSNEELTLADINMLLLYYCPHDRDEAAFFFKIAINYLIKYPILKNTLLAYAKTHDIEEEIMIHQAVREMNMLAIEALFELYPNIKSFRNSLLESTVFLSCIPEGLSKREAIIILLLKKGANPNSVNGHNGTPLHAAWRPSITKLLLEGGANPNAKDNDGLTPLALIIKEVLGIKHPEYAMSYYRNLLTTISHLLDFGADPTLIPNFGTKEKMILEEAKNLKSSSGVSKVGLFAERSVSDNDNVCEKSPRPSA